MDMVRTRRHIYSPRDIRKRRHNTSKYNSVDSLRNLTDDALESLSDTSYVGQSSEEDSSSKERTVMARSDNSKSLKRSLSEMKPSPSKKYHKKVCLKRKISGNNTVLKKRKRSPRKKRWVTSTPMNKKSNKNVLIFSPNAGSYSPTAATSTAITGSSTPKLRDNSKAKYDMEPIDLSDISQSSSKDSNEETMLVLNQKDAVGIKKNINRDLSANEGATENNRTQVSSTTASVLIINDTIEVIEVTDDEDVTITPDGPPQNDRTLQKDKCVSPHSIETIDLDYSDVEGPAPKSKENTVIVIDDNDSFCAQTAAKPAQSPKTATVDVNTNKSNLALALSRRSVKENEIVQPMNFNFGDKDSPNIMSDFINRVKHLEEQFIKHSIQPSVPTIPTVNNYGNNIYNPTVRLRRGLRLVVIDGSNVAMGHTQGKFFSVKGLQICIDYFVKRGHEVKAFVPQFRRQHLQSSSPAMLENLAKLGFVIFTPSRRVQGRLIIPYDDRYIVQCAAEHGGVIVSNDNYRDLLRENWTWTETIEKRLLMWTWCGDMIMFPSDPVGKGGPSLDQFLRYS